jgi:hypothetical protein
MFNRLFSATQKLWSNTMGMVSSESLAGTLGVSHKQVKKLILEYDVRAVPSGSSYMDPGTKQRMVLVDESSFHDGLSQRASKLSRPPKTEDAPKKKG